MKRESGASPEQSRCCELHLPYKGIGLLITHATACIYNKVGRQVNRSKSEDLQNVKSYFKLSRKEFKELKIKYSLIVLSKR